MEVGNKVRALGSGHIGTITDIMGDRVRVEYPDVEGSEMILYYAAEITGASGCTRYAELVEDDNAPVSTTETLVIDMDHAAYHDIGVTQATMFNVRRLTDRLSEAQESHKHHLVALCIADLYETLDRYDRSLMLPTFGGTFTDSRRTTRTTSANRSDDTTKS